MPAYFSGYKTKQKKVITQPDQMLIDDEPTVKGGSLSLIDRLSKMNFKSTNRLINPNISGGKMKTDTIKTDIKKPINPKLQKFIHLKL